MNTVSFRNYIKSDYESVKKILQEGKLYDATWDAKELLEKRYIEKPDAIIVAIIEDEVVGCVYVVDDMLPFIFRLAVKKKFRKRGIGKLLINEAMERLKAHGHKEIVLFADAKDEKLKNWYSKQGFIQSKSSRVGFWKEI